LPEKRNAIGKLKITRISIGNDGKRNRQKNRSTIEDSMNIETKKRFMEAWAKNFPGSDLPIACYYSNEINNVEFPNAPKPNPRGYTCIFAQIAPVRKGRARAFNKENLGCFGSFLPFGFDTKVTEEVKNYVCNVERVKKSYDHVDSMLGRK
jgi:hypothetical protein